MVKGNNYKQLRVPNLDGTPLGQSWDTFGDSACNGRIFNN